MVLHAPILLDFWFIGSLGCAGLLIAFWTYRKKPLMLFPAVLVVGYSLSIVLFYILARFRVPIVPLICVFAGLALDSVWRNRKTFLKKNVLIRLFPFVAGTLLTCVGYQAYRLGWEALIMRIARPNGVQLTFPEKQTLKDHGPVQFGGWEPLQVQGATIKKTLVALDTDSIQNASRINLRLFVVSPQKDTLILTIKGTTFEQQVASGQEWVELELQPDSFDYETENPKRLTVEMSLKSLTGAPFFIYIDKQRDYQRSIVDTTPADGELVIEAELFVDQKPSKL